jgi:hypothetical protein
MAHVRKVSTDVAINIGLGIANWDDIVGPKLYDGLDETAISRSPDWLWHVTAKTVLLWFMPSTWHDD